MKNGRRKKMELRTLEQVEKEIAETKAALNDVHGNETEVYARIVGYYRAVKHWNNGKKDEFFQRKMFTLEDSKEYDITAPSELQTKVEESTATPKALTEDSDIVSYKLYTRERCPNCPPVKAYMDKVEIEGHSIDVDTEEGLADAAENGVFATPTVIFYNANGVECARSHTVEELSIVLKKVAVTA
jgi:ribonucleoside-triphosphate reductase